MVPALAFFCKFSCSEVFGFYLLVSSFCFDYRSSASGLQHWRTTLLLLTATKQHKQTNKQTWLRTTHHSKRKSLKRERAKWHGSMLRSWEHKNDWERSYHQRGHVYRGLQHNRENRLHARCILFIKLRWWTI